MQPLRFLLLILLPLAIVLSFASLAFRADSWVEVDSVCFLNVLIVGPLWAAITFLGFAPARPSRSGKITALVATSLAYLVSAGGLSFWNAAVFQTRTACSRAVCLNNLKQLQVALWAYRADHGCFPPAYIADAQGKPMHSWRVLLLPYLELKPLYDAYRFDEPWNGPNNSKLACSIPEFRCSNSDPRSFMTNYVVIVGDRTAFPGSRSIAQEDIPDGCNSILIAEIANSDIPWMEPRDLQFDAMSFQVNDKTKPSISSLHSKGANILSLNGGTATLSKNAPPDRVKSLITIDSKDDANEWLDY